MIFGLPNLDMQGLLQCERRRSASCRPTFPDARPLYRLLVALSGQLMVQLQVRGPLLSALCIHKLTATS